MQWYFRIEIKFKISQRDPVRKKQTAPENDLFLHWFCSESFVSLSFKLNDHEVLKFSSCAGLPAWSDIKHVYLSSLAFHLLILMLIALFWYTTSNWFLGAFFNFIVILSYLNLSLLNWIHMLLYVFFCVIRQIYKWHDDIKSKYLKELMRSKVSLFCLWQQSHKNHSAVGDLCLLFCKEDSFCMVSINHCFLQSSGKSSVLENLVGRDFLPRGTCISNCLFSCSCSVWSFAFTMFLHWLSYLQ